MKEKIKVIGEAAVGLLFIPAFAVGMFWYNQLVEYLYEFGGHLVVIVVISLLFGLAACSLALCLGFRDWKTQVKTFLGGAAIGLWFTYWPEGGTMLDRDPHPMFILAMKLPRV